MDGVAIGETSRGHDAGTSASRSDVVATLLLALVAFAVRAALCALTTEVPGDGPTRAIAAWEWSHAPALVTWGCWPPGLLYLGGLVSVLVPDPRWSVRIVNALLGAALVPIFFRLVRAAFADDVAWAAALLLVVLPLHVEVSATSLAETSFVTEVLAGVYLVAVVRDPRPWQMALGLVALFWATMTRYEAWWLAPALIAAVAMRQRAPVVLATAVALAVFPVAWSLGNLRVLGDPFYGFRMAQKGAEIAGTPPIPLAEAAAMLATIVREQLGWPLALGVPLGVVVALATRTAWCDRRALVYAALPAIFFAAMTWFAMRRGHSIFDRYLLLGVVLVLPYAAWPWCAFGGRVRSAAVIASAGLALTAMAPRLASWPPRVTWITWTAPRDMETFVAWLRASAYRGDTVVLTDMGWTALYFALYWPEASARRTIVSAWTDDAELRAFLTSRRPTLLVTTRGDEALRARVEKVAPGTTIEAAPLVTIGAIEVHRLRRSASLTAP